MRQLDRQMRALLVAAVVALCAPATARDQHVKKQLYGTLPDGARVDLYTLKNAGGLEATVMTLGATLTTVRAPDRDGKLDIITLHKESLEGYARGHPLLGSIVGRFANRIAAPDGPHHGPCAERDAQHARRATPYDRAGL